MSNVKKGKTSICVKRSKSRLNDLQREVMLSYMEKHVYFAQGRLEKCPNAGQKMIEMRECLARKINAVEGDHRTSAQWWKVCVFPVIDYYCIVYLDQLMLHFSFISVLD